MADVKFLANIDLNDNQLLNIKLQHLSSDPTGVEGQIYYNTSDNEVKFYNGSAWQAFGTGTATGDITGVTLSGDSGSAADTSANVDLTIAGGTGITTSASSTTVTATIDAAQTGITSLLAADIKIGEDDQTKIDFETANEIHFYANNVEQVYLADNIFGPQSDSDVDLGSSSVRWKDAYVDSITVTGNADIDGDVDVDGTLETDALTIGGTAIATVIAGTTVTNATNSAHVLITDNENTNEENQVTFIEGAGGGGANRGLEADGDFTYNPSTGTVSATIFKGNIDAVDGDFDGTLEADAITVGGTALNTVIAGVTVTNATTAAVATTVTITDNESTDENNPIVFVAGADADGGNLGLETDGTAHYNPSSGKITATAFAGNLTGNVTGNVTGNLVIGGHSMADVDIGSEFTDADDHLMSAGAIKEKIEDYSYITASSSDTLTNKTIAASQVTEISNITAAEGAQLENIGSTTISATQWGYLGAASGAITNTDVNVSAANLKTALGDGFPSNAVTIGDSDDTVTFANDVTVSGDLTITGNTITTNVETVTVKDPLIRIANNNAADAIDVGIYGTYVSTIDGTSATRFSGLFRDASEDTDSWTLFKDLSDEPTTTVNSAHSTFAFADLKLGTLKATTITGSIATASQTNITGVGTITTGVWNGTAIASAYIAGDAITGAKIADDAIDSEHYTNGSIDAAHIASNAVTSAKINADAVTGAKIADDAINSEHYTDGSIDTAHIADDQVTYAKIQNVSATNVVLGRDSSGAGVIEEISASSLRTIINVENGATADQSKSDIDGLAITTVGTLDTGDATAVVSAASTSAAGKVELATTAEALAGTDTARAVTAAGLAARSHVATIGDGSDLDIAITHNLGTRNVIVQMFDASSYQTIYAEVVRTDANTVTINTNSGSEIASSDVTVLITKID